MINALTTTFPSILRTNFLPNKIPRDERAALDKAENEVLISKG